MRLEAPSDVTVVWPFRPTLEARINGEWALDAQGNEIGRIGGPFRFGGGIVPFLHKDLGFKEPDLTEIQTQCPGRYWIVGEVLEP